MTLIQFIIAAGVFLPIAMAVTSLTWLWLNLNAAKKMIDLRDQQWRTKIAQGYVKREDSFGTVSPSFMDTEPAQLVPFTQWKEHDDEAFNASLDAWREHSEARSRSKDEQADDSTLAMVEHQGTPAPMPTEPTVNSDGSIPTVTTRWDGTTFKLMAQEIAHCANNPDILERIAEAYHGIALEDINSQGGAFSDTAKFHYNRRKLLIGRASWINAENCA